MRFADPLDATCPSCDRCGAYAVEDLLALRARCQYCSASLEQIGLEMRVMIAEVKGIHAIVDMTLEFERKFGVTITDPELESIQCPYDFAPYLKDLTLHRSVEGTILEALGHARRGPVDASDCHRSFTDIFAFDVDFQEWVVANKTMEPTR